MKIQTLVMNNFKRFEHAVIRFESKLNYLQGKNGAGKSAIKDAIIFAFYNRTADGSNKDTDTFITRGLTSSKVEVTFENGHSIIRKRSEKATKLAYVDLSQSDEDAEVSQRDVEGTVIPYADDFLSVFVPGYFMSLGQTEQRSFVQKFLKKLDRRELFLKVGGTQEMIERFHLDLSSFEECLKTGVEMKKDFETDKEKARTTIEFLENEIIEVEGKSVDDLRANIDELDKAIALKKEWDVYNAGASALQPIIDENARMEARLKELEAKTITIPEEPTKEVIHRIEDAIRRLPALNVPRGLCPNCLQNIPDEHSARIEAENAERSKMVLALEQELEEEKRKYDALVKAREECLSEARALRSEKELAAARIVKLPVLVRPETQDAYPESVGELERRKASYEMFISKLLSLEDLRVQLRESSEGYRQASKIVDLLKPSGIPSIELEEQLAPLQSVLQTYFPTGKFILLRPLKNGMEFKNVFDIEIDEKPYARLSSGEKKRLDVILSLMFNSFLKEPGIIFIDDADLVDAEGMKPLLDMALENNIQVFISKVTNDEELQVITKNDNNE